MAGPVAGGGAGADRSGTAEGLIREHLRVLAGAAFVGLVVGLPAGILGRVAMRVLVLTAPARVDGAITDDDAVVNQFTLDGTLGLVVFVTLATVALAWMYVGARSCLPAPVWLRAAVWAILLWSVGGAAVFDPRGFDFTQLTPVWLGVASFSTIFVAVGALLPIGVERAIARWPPRPRGLLPLLSVAPVMPLYLGGVVAASGAALSERYRAVRVLGVAVMAGIVLRWGTAAIADAIRIVL